MRVDFSAVSGQDVRLYLLGKTGRLEVDRSTIEKKCRKCRIIKVMTEFHRAGWNWQGFPKFSNLCAKCIILTRVRVSGEYKKRADRVQQRSAADAVRYAVQNGKLVKPNACQFCKKVLEKNKLHAHHYAGYKNPLKVHWVCPTCHKESHRREWMSKYIHRQRR